MTPVSARPASTVVLVRESASPGVDVLLVRRHDKVAFMGGAYVFPGGRVDEQDLARAAGDENRAFRIAAMRETMEEAAVVLNPDALIPIAHWVTPDIETRRYDTHFFLAVMPERQIARHDNLETTDLIWIGVADAIDRCRRGEIMLPPPTWTTLRRLEPLTTLDDVLMWAERTTVVRIQPQFNHLGERRLLTLPGDPLYPTIPGWEVPEDTRFVLEEGKGWKPIPV